jgi:hypothetical protein
MARPVCKVGSMSVQPLSRRMGFERLTSRNGNSRKPHFALFPQDQQLSSPKSDLGWAPRRFSTASVRSAWLAPAGRRPSSCARPGDDCHRPGRRNLLPGYWVPAAQVPDGLAVLPLDGVFEQVGQSPAGGDAGDVGDPPGCATPEMIPEGSHVTCLEKAQSRRLWSGWVSPTVMSVAGIRPRQPNLPVARGGKVTDVGTSWGSVRPGRLPGADEDAHMVITMPPTADNVTTAISDG